MAALRKLPLEFYRNTDVLDLSRQLLGKILVSRFNGIRTSGRIVELEAYAGVLDRASHAFGGRRTQRNDVMYEAGGVAYVYLCYGIHQLFNVVSGEAGNPQAILLRGLEPLRGVQDMLLRTGKSKPDHTLTRGPGNLSKALGIATVHSRTPLTGSSIYIADDGFNYPQEEVASSPRIGVDYAGPDALLPYRFYIRGNPFVSGRPR